MKIQDEISETLLNIATHYIKQINKKLLPKLSYEQRMSLFNVMTDGYCIYCGEDRRPCYCRRDE